MSEMSKKPRVDDDGCSNGPRHNWAHLPSVILYDVYARLDHNERLLASSVCRNWRQALYHPSFFRNVRFKLDRRDLAHFQPFASECSHLVRHATVCFHSLAPACTGELVHLLQLMMGSRTLKSLLLEPSHCRLQLPAASDKCAEAQLFESLLQICPSLERLSLGCCEDLQQQLPRLLEAMAQSRHAARVRLLGLASLKYDPDHYLIHGLDIGAFAAFQNLQILSVDYDHVCDNLLRQLHGLNDLQRLVVHVHGLSTDHPGTTNEAWKRLRKLQPNCELRLILIHAYEAVRCLHRVILHQDMPLSHLKVYFCEHMNINVLEMLSHFYTETFRSLVWIDSQSVQNRWELSAMTHRNPDPIIYVAWLCYRFEEFVLLGYKYAAEEIVAIVRLRSNSLKTIEVADDDVIDSKKWTRDEFLEEISEALKKPWQPLAASQLHPVIRGPAPVESDEYLLPRILADLN